MTAFTYTVVLRGTDNEKSTLTYDLGDFANATPGDDFAEALTVAGNIKSELAAVTDAYIAEESLRHVISQDSQLPAAADIFEEALVTVYLNDPTEAEKVHQVRIPAPAAGLFLGTNGAELDIVDINDADLTDYVGALSSHVYLSDGEQINTATGTNGIKKGYRNIRKRKLGR